VEYRRYANARSRGHARGVTDLALGLFIVALAACSRQPEQASAPPAQAAPAQTGVASYYAKGLAGRPTASGEPHEPNALTAASPSLPLGTRAKVTNTGNGRSVTVKVNDRGPYARNRILDLSRRAAERLGFEHEGLAKVAVQPLDAPPQAR
jgi:rare lipoprotein A